MQLDDRYCLSINVIAFVYAGFQAAYYLMIGSQVKHIHARCLFDFFMDQAGLSIPMQWMFLFYTDDY